ncbi:helix-turn-helix domain-containing protein [Streptacidiphilus sp. N1-3]|uniref:Helix-turn-helix domain-containing protein n=1 Tax=Streptacidiphilus alkalitolerans TaxID=3342712 RepID=A0ABV6X5G2_9ACTN
MDFRSRRLEALLGGRLEAITYQELAALRDNPNAAEGEDLDYKRELTAKDEESKEEFAKDVVAFANRLGGVLIVGMADAKGIPSLVVDSDVSDAHQRHLMQVAAKRITPPVRLEMRAVHNPAIPHRGFLLIAVPRSPQAPHAILGAPVNAAEQALRFPRRSGSRTEWLTETAVATSYYRRFAAVTETEHRLDTIEGEALSVLPQSNRPHLLLALTPEIPGDMPITQASYERYRDELRRWHSLMSLLTGRSFYDVRIGARRIAATNAGGAAVRCELHRDGSGAFIVRLREEPVVDGDQYHSVEPSDLVLSLLSGLQLLGSHARDRAAALGTLIIRASLMESPHTHPLGPLKPPAMTPFPPVRLEWVDRSGFRDNLSSQECSYAHAEAAALPDDLADGGAGLVQTAALLADELVQAFGLAEVGPVSLQGEIREASWSSHYREAVVRWAEQHHIPVVRP